MGFSPRPERYDEEIVSAGAMCLPDEAFSTHRSSTGSLRRLRELEIAQGMADGARSKPALRGIVLNLNINSARHFLHRSCRALSSTRCQPHHGLFWACSCELLRLFLYWSGRLICASSNPHPIAKPAVMKIGTGTRWW